MATFVIIVMVLLLACGATELAGKMVLWAMKYLAWFMLFVILVTIYGKF